MLSGTKIRLRLAEDSDLELLASWYRDPEFRGTFYNDPGTVRPHDLANLVQDALDEDSGSLLIAETETGRPVGLIGYFNPFSARFFRGLEIWFQVHPEHRRRGIAGEAVPLLVNYLFNAFPITRIQATVADGNDTSARVLQRSGMALDGVYRSVYFLRGRWVDMDLYVITRSDWVSEESYRARLL